MNATFFPYVYIIGKSCLWKKNDLYDQQSRKRMKQFIWIGGKNWIVCLWDVQWNLSDPNNKKLN